MTANPQLENTLNVMRTDAIRINSVSSMRSNRDPQSQLSTVLGPRFEPAAEPGGDTLNQEMHSLFPCSLRSVFKRCRQLCSSPASPVRRRLEAVAHGRRRDHKTTVDQTLIRGLVMQPAAARQGTQAGLALMARGPQAPRKREEATRPSAAAFSAGHGRRYARGIVIGWPRPCIAAG